MPSLFDEKCYNENVKTFTSNEGDAMTEKDYGQVTGWCIRQKVLVL